MSALLSPRRLSGLVTLVIVAVLTALLPAAPASAHNQLVETVPEKDAVLQSPPEQVVLEFIERLDPKFTTIVVTDEAKQRVATSEPEISGGRGVVRFTESLAAGTYTVAYRVVSLDGHPVQGSFKFTVGGGDASAAPSAASSAEADATPASTADSGRTESDEGGVSTAVVVAGLIVLLAAAGGLVAWRRSRSGTR